MHRLAHCYDKALFSHPICSHLFMSLYDIKYQHKFWRAETVFTPQHQHGFSTVFSDFHKNHFFFCCKRASHLFAYYFINNFSNDCRLFWMIRLDLNNLIPSICCSQHWTEVENTVFEKLWGQNLIPLFHKQLYRYLDTTKFFIVRDFLSIVGCLAECQNPSP